jgi:hypothetical protein
MELRSDFQFRIQIPQKYKNVERRFECSKKIRIRNNTGNRETHSGVLIYRDTVSIKWYGTLMLNNMMALQIAGFGCLVAAVGTQEPSLLMILNERKSSY